MIHFYCYFYWIQDQEAGDIGKVTLSELVDFLRRNIIPDNLSRSELLLFRQKARHYRLEKGALLFSPKHREGVKARQVPRSKQERIEAIKKAHGGKALTYTLQVGYQLNLADHFKV